MATTVAHLQAILSANTRDFDRAIGRSESKMSKFGSMARAGALAAGVGIAYGLGKVAKIGWDEFNQGQKVAAQTNAVLESTGGVANVTAKHVEELGRKMMLKSGIDDEVIKSGQNVLLTFKDIRNETGKGNKIFDQATQLTTDLSVAMGKDMNSSAVMVGKALNDPIKGLTSLTRVGVQFTDGQKKAIEKMVEAGDKMGAQKLILKELRTEFGGSAKAAGETFGGQINILRERFSNWAGEMTEKAIPLLRRFAEWLMPKVERAVRFVGDVINDLVIPAIQSFRDTIEKHRPELERIWRRVSKAVEVMWSIVKPILKFLLTEVLPRYLGIAIKAIDKTYEAIVSIIDAAKRIKNWFTGTFVQFWTGLWDTVKNLFLRFKLWMEEKALELVLNILEPFSHLPGKLGGWARDAKDRVKPQLDNIRGQIDALDREARAVANEKYNVTFITNAAKVKSDIEDMTATARSATSAGGPLGGGDFGSFGFGRTSLIAMGRQLQSMGFQVGEHPSFGGVSPVHVPGSYHYQGRALDINWPGGGGAEMSRLDWLYSRLRRMPGIVELLWRTAGHFDHLHVAMDRAGWYSLRPGLNLVGNYTGRPEPVYATGGGGGPGVNVYLTNRGVLGSEREVLNWLRNATERLHRQGGTAF